MRRLLVVPLWLLLCGYCPAQDMSPQQVIEKAIAAHGGTESLSQARCERRRLRGTLQVGGKSVPFTNDIAVQLPGRYRSSVTLLQGERSHTIMHTLDGDRASILIDGQSQSITGLHLAQLQQTVQLEQAMRLVPLLRDPSYTLQALPTRRYNEHVFVGLRVSRPGKKDLVLYFDQKSGLLVKSEYRLDGPAGKEVVHEAYYSQHRDYDGLRRAGQILVFRDGQKVMEAELLEVRSLQTIEQVEFRP